MYKALIEKRIKQNGVKFGSYGSDPDDPQSGNRGRGGFTRGRGRGHFNFPHMGMGPPGGMMPPGPFCEDGFGPPEPMMMGGFCDDFDGPGFGGPGPGFGGPGFFPDGGGPMGPGPWRGGGRGRARGGPGPFPGPMGMGPMRGGMGHMGSMGEGPMGGPGMRGRGGHRGRGGFLYNSDMPLGFGNFDEQGFGNFDDPSFAADMDPSDEQGEGYNPFQMLASASNRGGPSSFGRGGAPARGWGRGGAIAKPKPVTPVINKEAEDGEDSQGAEAFEEKVENPILEAAGQEGFDEFKKGWGSAFAKTNPDAEFYVSTELKKFRYNNELNAMRGGRGGMMMGRGGHLGMGRGGKRLAKKNDVELEPFNQVPPPREPTPEPQHPEEEVEKYFKKVLKDRPPGAWVNEMAKQKHWFVHGVEGSKMIGRFRRAFDFTLTIHDMVVIGKGPKKKDAKNDAYKKMAIKFGEYFCYLPILKKPEKEKPKEEETKDDREVKEETPKPLVPPAEVTTAGGVKVINSILETKALQTAYDTSLTAAVDHRMVPEPEEIRTISSKDMAKIEGG